MNDIIGFLDALHVVLATGLAVASMLFRRLKKDMAAQERRLDAVQQRSDAMQQQIITLAGLSRDHASVVREDGVVRETGPEQPYWMPPKGWMRHSEAVRLAQEYVLAVPGMRRAQVASLVAAEFLDNQPKYHDSDRRLVERIPLEAWLLTHRLPMPQRELWRGLDVEIGLNEHDEVMAFDPAKPALPDLGKDRQYGS